jgi:ectoine hydroxylase-related dioxygenase (phytanoyl-CoA dioxygenase family)
MNTTEKSREKFLIELEKPYDITEAHQEQFRCEGFIKLKEVLSPELIAYYGEVISAKVIELNNNLKPMSERSTYERAFLQVGNIWTKSDIVKEFTFSRRLARIAAELLGVCGVRLYHDQALYKEAGGGITPWHADQYYWPVNSDKTITVWAPLQETPIELGPLSFSVGSHKFNFGRDLEISDESERKLQGSLKDCNYPLEESAYALGEVSYHYGWTFHRAGANVSDRARKVMTVIYVDDETRLIEPRNKGQRSDAEALFPHLKPGDKLEGPLLPAIYSRGTELPGLASGRDVGAGRLA